MLVEDDASIAELYSMKLRMDGYTVHLAADATTADVIFEQAAPQVVCVDSRLPGSSGRGSAERFAGAGAIVLLLTNDQRSYENPPPGAARSPPGAAGCGPQSPVARPPAGGRAPR